MVNTITVQKYTDAILDGAEFPPLIVFYDGSDYWLADGFHRLEAAGNAGHYARSALAMATEVQQGRLWWLDCGNAFHNGQVHIGNIYRNFQKNLVANELGLIKGLPAPHIQAPDLLEPEPVPQSLSCAELTIREEQSLTINLQTAAIAAQYVYQFLIRRELTTYETTFTLDPPTTRSQLITEANFTNFQGDSINNQPRLIPNQPPANPFAADEFSQKRVTRSKRTDYRTGSIGARCIARAQATGGQSQKIA